MKKILILITILSSLFLTGCNNNEKIYDTNMSIVTTNYGTDIVVYPICEDKVVCYWKKAGYGAGMSCIESLSLYDVYCS